MVNRLKNKFFCQKNLCDITHCKQTS
jgi:hypothetical protein